MKKNLVIAVGIVLFQLLMLLKLQFTAWPEMLLWPYLAIHGLLPYKDIAIAHTPHLIVDLVVIYKIFGVGITQLKIYTWFLIVFTDLVVYWVTKKLWKDKVALMALTAFIFLQMFFDGNGLWFDLVLAPLAIITYYLVENKKYFWAGAFWAFMFFTKQTAVFFLLPIIFTTRKVKGFIFGAVLVTIFWFIILGLWGNLPSFYHWAVSYGIFVLPRAQGQIQLPDVKNLIVSLFPFLVFLPLIFKTKYKNINLVLWAIAGVMGAYPRFEYFHFQPALPFLAVAISIVLTNFNKNNKLMRLLLIFYLIGCLYLFASFFIRNWGEGTRFYEQNVQDITQYVKNNTNSKDKIFVMNWWDNIYALTGTLPATDPWVPQLSWYQDIPGIQEKEVLDLTKSKPKLIILQDYVDSGLASYIPQKLYTYVMSNYHLKEKVDGLEILIPNK